MPAAEGLDRIVVEPLGQSCLRFFAFFEPEPQHAGHVVAQIGARRGEKDFRPRLRGGHGGGNRSAPAANDRDVNLVGDGNLARRLIHARCLSRGGKTRTEKANYQQRSREPPSALEHHLYP